MRDNSHEAIIDMELWDAVQLELQRRENFRKENGIKKLSCKADSPLYSKVFCGICGGKMTLWQGDTIRHSFWKCRNAEAKYQKTCQSPKLSDDLLRMATISAWNAIVTERDTYIPQWKKTMWEGNALERLRARQMIELTAEGSLDCEVPELTRMTVQKVVVKDSELIITFMDGTEKHVNL